MKIIKKIKNPKFLVITPLKEGDKISKETKKTVKRNKTSFDWISYEGNNNIPSNTQLALEEYEKEFGTINYIIKIDNDISCDRFLLDEMYNTIKNSKDDIGYVYCSFSYILKDDRKISFNGDFNKERLLKSNYISSNSMIKRYSLKEIGGFVCDSKYERLLDWALWLKFLKNEFKGVSIKNKGFETPLNEGSVSSRGQKDYNKKYQRVYDDFILPIIN